MGPCSAHPPPLQIISQGQAKAESITLDLGTHIQHRLLVELAAFLRRWVCVLPCTEGALQPPSLCPRWGSKADQCPLPARGCLSQLDTESLHPTQQSSQQSTPSCAKRMSHEGWRPWLPLQVMPPVPTPIILLAASLPSSENPSILPQPSPVFQLWKRSGGRRGQQSQAGTPFRSSAGPCPTSLNMISS